MFLALDRSGYAARREDVGVLGSLIMLIVPTSARRIGGEALVFARKSVKF